MIPLHMQLFFQIFIASEIYHKDKNGFYVYAKPNLCNLKSIVKYVSRYLGRPAIALSRIDSYDGDNVTFHYNRHENNSFVRKTLPTIDFIKLLIQHIPEKNFKMTRYYGLYARHRFILDFNTWRKRFLLTMSFVPVPGLFDFFSYLFHTVLITDGRLIQLDQKYIDELRQKYIKNPPEGMTPKLVRNMTNSDLLDMITF